MKEKIDPALEKNEEWKSGVKLANQLLEEELGNLSGLATATWNLSFHKDKKEFPCLTLTLSDYTGAECVQFAPDELRNESLLRTRLHELWGRLLKRSMREQNTRLSEVVKQLDGN